MNDTAIFNLLLAAIGGPTVMVGTFLAARHFVYRQSNPTRGQEYLTWFRAQKAAEHDEAVRAEIARQTRGTREKEFSR